METWGSKNKLIRSINIQTDIQIRMLSTLKKMKKSLYRVDIKLSKIGYILKDFNLDNKLNNILYPKKKDVEDSENIN